MRVDEIPQDKSALENITRDVYYVKNKVGDYETALSTGWEPKSKALENAWEDVDLRIKESIRAVKERRKSPIYYYMNKNLMDFGILSSYVGMMRIRVIRHMNPNVFFKLNDKILKRYADVFEITVDELKSFKG